MEAEATYEAARARITDLVKNSDPATPVPTCPGWSVKDVVAHLAGSLGAYISRALEGATSPTWGDKQVEQRRAASSEECLAEWEKNTGEAGEVFESDLATVVVADVLAHEQDIRTAIGSQGQREGEGVLASVELALGFIGQKITGAKLPALAIVTEDFEKQIGEGEPAGTLRTSTYELWRALHGRRSPAQVAAFDWDGDSGTWMDVLFLFGPAESDIRE